MSKYKPRYPIYVISKGRHDCCLTAKFLCEDKVDFRLVVEPQEEHLYRKLYGSRVITLPFSNLGQGSIPARNWVWEHAKAQDYKRHWILDDNISGMNRRHKTIRIKCEANVGFHCCEEFVDRYENIALAGMTYRFLVPDKQSFPPFFLNVHVYSCILIDNNIPFRWRGRYNEDADLCLQVLSSGLCTVLFNAFSVDKKATMTMKGGNSDELYKGDGRLKMARSLERAWPHTVTVTRRFRRPQHHIHDYWKRFDTPLIRRTDIDWDSLPAVNNFGMTLKQKAPEVKSPVLREMLKEQKPNK